MDIHIVEQENRIVVIAPRGRIDAFSVPALRKKLESLLADDVINFVVDLSNVAFLDSAGMAVLVALLKRARNVGGDVRLVWPNVEASRRVLHLTNFDRVFAMAESAEAAVAAF